MSCLLSLQLDVSGQATSQPGCPLTCFFSCTYTVCRQCPGTTIERNFKVGTSLSVLLAVNGSSALAPLCDHSSFTSSSSDSSAASTSSCQQVSTSAEADDTAARGRRLRVAGEGGRSPPPLSSATNHRLLQEGDQSTNATLENTDGGGSSWAWDEDGPTFGLGELSRIRLSSHVLFLDDGGGEAWSPLQNTSSAAAVVGENDEDDGGPAGVITASLASFGVQEAVFSTMLFFSRVEAVEEASGRGGGVISDSE